MARLSPSTESTIAPGPGDLPAGCVAPPGGTFPLSWNVTERGAHEIAAGELEHCSDFAQIRAVLERIITVINQRLAGRTFSTEAALRRATERLDIPPFDEVGNLFDTMVRESRLRDGHGFHSMPAVVVQWRTADSRCRPYVNINTLSGRGAVSTRQLFLDAGVPARYLRGLR